MAVKIFINLVVFFTPTGFGESVKLKFDEILNVSTKVDIDAGLIK